MVYLCSRNKAAFLASPCTADDCGLPFVFVVDDDSGMRDALQVLLSSYGMGVETYPSTEEFSEAYRPRPKACLILDQHLERSTGLAFLASEAWSAIRIPVILLTANGSSVLQRQALEAGAAAYLEKPVVGTELIGAIQRLQNVSTASSQ